MAKEKHEPYEFLGNMIVTLMNTDSMFTYRFFKEEFPISDKTLIEMKRGEDMCIYQYVRLVRCMTEYIHLTILMDVLLKQLKVVLSSNCDLVIATVPHRTAGNSQPEEWKVVIQWDGVCV